MKTGDAIRVSWLALLDAMVADTRWNPGIYGDALVKASAVLTALGDTDKDLDSRCVMAVKQFVLNDSNY